jgi:hypothetical protein
VKPGEIIRDMVPITNLAAVPEHGRRRRFHASAGMVFHDKMSFHSVA